MPRPPSKKGHGDAPPAQDEASPKLDPLRRGMPAQDSIVEVREYKRGGKVYRVIKTTEKDAYDEPERPPRARKRRR